MSRVLFNWTEQNTKACLDSWNFGDSSAILAERYGVSRNAIIGRLTRLKEKGWYVREGAGTPKPVSLPSDRYGKLPAPSEQWSEPQNQEVIGMWKGGKSAVEIMTCTGRTFGSIKAKLDLLSKLRLIVRDGRRRAERPAAAPKPKKEKNQESYGVKAISFTQLRQEDRVQSYTIQGNRAVIAFDAAMPNTGTPLVELKRSQCRFPTSNSYPWLFCGETTNGKSSYCHTCASRVFGRAA